MLMMTERSYRTILHLDLDAFYCTVEEQRDPTLRGTAFAVGGAAEGRGVVSSCSYEARRFGVRSAMPMARARTLCPHLLCLPTNFPAYRAASEQVMDRLRALTPRLEQISIDEAFLDVTALPQTGRLLAQTLQTQIHTELGLACSLGIAASKLVAKIATDVGKSSVTSGRSPQTICEVPPGTEVAFLAPLPSSALWGVGPKTEEKLASLGLHTIGDIARWPEADLRRRLGRHGEVLSRHARGLDERELTTEREAKSISKETTFARDVREAETLRLTLQDQVRTVCRQLAKEGVGGTAVKLKIRWPDFVTVTRQLSVAMPTADEAVLWPLALRLLEQVWPLGQPVRLLGFGVSGLEVPLQLSLWDTKPADEAAQERRVQAVLAAVSARLGADAIKRGSEIKGSGQLPLLGSAHEMKIGKPIEPR